MYVALVLSVLGLGLLIIVSGFLEPAYVKVGDVDSGMLENSVRLKGVVAGVHAFKGGSLLLSVADGNSSVDVYLPYSVSSGLDKASVNGSAIDVVGVVELYNGKLEVVADKPENVRLR